MNKPYPDTPVWPFPSWPLKPWTPAQEKAYQQDQVKHAPQSPF